MALKPYLESWFKYLKKEVILQCPGESKYEYTVPYFDYLLLIRRSRVP